MNSNLKEYDEKFDTWFQQVSDLLNFKGSLDELFLKLKQDDPYGSFDSNLSPKEFIDNTNILL